MYHQGMEKSERPPTSFGKVLVETRRALGITQYQLAKLSGVNERYLNYLEHGVKEPRLSMIIKLARAMGISAGTMVDAVAREETACESRFADSRNTD